MAAARSATVNAVRSFNRFYTRKIGVLHDRHLDSPFSLTEVRVLFELARRPGLTATVLQADLDLDAGYLSRMLARFSQLGFVVRRRSRRDGRQVHLGLTPKGRRVFARLDRRSAARIGELIGHLPAPGQDRLVGLLASVRRLLAAPDAPHPAIVLREPRAGDLGWVVQRHGAIYAAEYGWDHHFEGLVAGIVADFAGSHDPHRERCWIAELEGMPVGCVFLVRHSATVAKLRLLLVDPDVRGAGLGGRLVAACVDFARSAGYRKVILWTNDVLQAARHLYAKAGFKLVRSSRHHSFGHDLVGETWALPLP